MPKTSKNFQDLINVVRKLRAPKGCPWDKVQTHATLKPYMVEEVYEALEAIDQKDPMKLAEELGDLLLHIVMHAEMGREKKEFTIDDVISSITAKMIRRHPHVFGKHKVKNVEEVWKKWEEIKSQEVKGKSDKVKSILESVPNALPALYRADKVQRRAARVGFDWNNIAGAWDKVHEEEKEIHEVIKKCRGSKPKCKKKLKEELGDLLFAVVNVTRKMDIDAEEALQEATSKFMRRFKGIEETAARTGRHVSKMSLPEMDAVWRAVKKLEKNA